jgi:hypothetical protein
MGGDLGSRRDPYEDSEIPFASLPFDLIDEDGQRRQTSDVVTFVYRSLTRGDCNIFGQRLLLD